MVNFAKKSGLDWLKNSQFWSFCKFSNLFPKNEAEIDLEWPISLGSQLFPSFANKASHFWRNLKNFHSWWEGGGYISKFFEFFNFFKLFDTEVAQNDHNGEFCQKRGLDWLKMAKFWSFCMFSHLFPLNEAQIDSEWPVSPDSQLFPSFATKASHFWRNLKNFCSGGIYWQIFLDLQLFESFPTKVAQNNPQWPILPPKWLRLAQNGQFWLNFNENLNISAES